jgi:hypothetical protein
LAVWNDKASRDTTRARQVIFFIVELIFRLLGGLLAIRRGQQKHHGAEVNIRAPGRLV